MGLFETIQAAATSAHRTTARLCGMADDADGNTLFSGSAVARVGVYGLPQVVEKMMLGGGYRRRTETLLSITRDQLDAPPSVRSKVTRIDVSPAITYVIDTINLDDPLHYELVLLNFGE